MRSILHPFVPTNHFKHRCWERCLNDHLLCRILREVSIRREAYAVVISAKWLQKIANSGYPVPDLIRQELLVIFLKGNRLITLYSCSDPTERRFNFNYVITL